MTGQRFPIRLLVHYQPARVPLVQITEGIKAIDGTIHGAGTHAVDMSDSAREIELRDPATGRTTGDRVTLAHVLAVLAGLSHE